MKTILITLVSLILTSNALAQVVLTDDQKSIRANQISEVYYNIYTNLNCSGDGLDANDVSHFKSHTIPNAIERATSITVNQGGQLLLLVDSRYVKLQISTSADFYSITSISAQKYKQVANLATGELVMVLESSMECSVSQ